MNFVQIADVFSTKHEENELVQDYISRMRLLCSQAKLNNDMTFNALLNGLHPSIQSFVLTKDPQTVQDIEQQAVMAEIVAPKPVATAPLYAAMDKIKAQMEELLVASTPIHSHGRSHSTSPDNRIPVMEHGRRWSRDKDYRWQRSTSWDNAESRKYRHHERIRSPPSLQYGHSRNNVLLNNRTCFKSRGQYRLGHKCWKQRKAHRVCFNCGRQGHIQYKCKSRTYHTH